ncbi:MAG: ribosomal RNA small subunit methyltransferase A [Candidatus Nitronauta litoralis]|uniref:Ribosomal RNA small subunit methyltransferase A n=1 Tax=Candidatus Nitronauta litoralis TaxID=2705533 RepID=A0A7T0BVZ9_9BACT|nr:MAG: ribosomal RNA small subunit methyltransferase A [Candidatus Nitronauta litoralis]
MKKRKQPFGQNYLVDLNAAKEIVHLAHVKNDGCLVEIGPGKGVLTHDLLPLTSKLIALEIDPILCRGLKKKYGDRENFHLVQADAQKIDYGSLAPRFQVVSNLPYYAATPIIKRLIHYRKHITDMVLMLQREVAARMTAKPGTREYGSLTLFIQYHCEARRLLEVGAECFYPKPKVDSTVIRLTPRQLPPVVVNSETNLFQLIHTAFLHKRKTLRNNLKELNGRFHIAMSAIENMGIDPNRRAEELTLQQFAQITNALETKND